MLVRVYRPSVNREFLINTDHISMIEILHGVPGKDGASYFATTPNSANDNPDAVRMYRFQIGNESFLIAGGKPNDPVAKVFGDLYNKAIKS